jgi:hypothetical protein
MSDDQVGAKHRNPANPEPREPATIWDAQVEQLDEAECMRLISGGGVGRLAYSGRLGLMVLPVKYMLHEGSIVVRAPLDSTTDADLRTGIRGADYKVTFEIDQVVSDREEGWFVLIQGPAHHVHTRDDCLAAWSLGPESSAWHTLEHFVRITPSMIVGRRLRRAA